MELLVGGQLFFGGTQSLYGNYGRFFLGLSGVFDERMEDLCGGKRDN